VYASLGWVGIEPELTWSEQSPVAGTLVKPSGSSRPAKPPVLTNSKENERRFIMSRSFRRGERRIRARGIKQDPPDLRRLARALIALAEAQAEADAEAQSHRAATNHRTEAKTRRSPDGRKDAA
jgi:hypothetical protein